MGTVISFPTARRAAANGAVAVGCSAQITILPVVRIERHVEPVAKSPRAPRKPAASGGGRRAR